ncbi:MAG: hypothetical protein Q8S27_02465 [Hoeflea sp.]|nr:hypothetical protein [Hoeflea sp.]
MSWAADAIISASDWSALLRSVKLDAPGAKPGLEYIAGSPADTHPVRTIATPASIAMRLPA